MESISNPYVYPDNPSLSRSNIADCLIILC